MNNTDIYNKLKDIIEPSNIKINESMKKHTSFKIGGNADFFVTAKRIEDVKNILKFSKENEINITVIGNGSNILVTDKGIRGITMQIDLQELEIENKIEDKAELLQLPMVAEDEEIYSYSNVIVNVGAGVKLGKLARNTCKRRN